MRGLDFSRYALTSCVASALLSACGGWQSPIGAPGVMPQDIPGAVRSAHVTPLLYVTNFTGNSGIGDVTVYHAKATNPSPVATITKGINSPTGDCTDAAGTLYVANEPASGPGWVSEYLAGQTKPYTFITKGINTPAFCAIDSKGNLWVTNISIPDLAEYPKGSTKPRMVITSGLTFPVGIAIDRSGNIYVANGWGGSSQNVQVYAPGSKSPSRTITDGVQSPVGIAVDENGTLYVTNLRQNNVEEYRSGQGYPYQAITDQMNEPSAATVGKNGWLYVTDDGNPAIIEFSPGSITPSSRQITNGLAAPGGSAYYPPLLP
jgi:hypothetical protein